jgi:hypothetical protein
LALRSKAAFGLPFFRLYQGRGLVLTVQRGHAITSLGFRWFASKPGLAPAGDLLFFASPKKPKEKKGDPMVWVPALRYGQPAVLAENGVELELAFGSDNRSP